MRTLIDLPEDEIRWLDFRASAEKTSRAALVREAVTAFRAEANDDWLRRGYGYWKDRDDIGDAVEYQRAIREDRSCD